MISLLEGIATTRAIRRYTTDPIPDDDLATIMFAASRAPSGSNRQPFRFLVLRDGPKADRGEATARQRVPRRMGGEGRERRIRGGHGSRRHVSQGAHGSHDAALRRPLRGDPGRRACVPRALPGRSLHGGCVDLPGVPEPAARRPRARVRRRAHGLARVRRGGAARAAGHPGRRRARARRSRSGDQQGHHGPVRRRPIRELVYDDTWGGDAAWAVDPPDARFTSAGPPKR